ncbi:LytR/AlgR family response regulator transcription factor [Desertivirga arenae]|uniref:LytR/AlgR family response regulator transcription factor n=1 Tax=Desertivirga arenae TaxID=2810309 RepID=UPI001A97029C|nr:LytTR family DNA-binding domain-containing protein [Pedobacter sp. SYSU D00823]
MFTCSIIDNNISIATLKGYIELVDHMTLVGAYNSPKNLVDIFVITKPDIIFMDFSLAKDHFTETIQFSNISTLIITGDSPANAFEALEMNAIDYLLKPVEYSSFLRTVIKSKKIRFRELDKSLRNLTEVSDHFFIKKDSSGKKIVKVKYDDIIYIEGSQNYISLIMENCSHLTYLTMKEIEESLPADKFIRVHKSYIVNINKITAVDGNQIFLNEHEKIIVGSSYKGNFTQKLNEKLLKTKRNITKLPNSD